MTDQPDILTRARELCDAAGGDPRLIHLEDARVVVGALTELVAEVERLRDAHDWLDQMVYALAEDCNTAQAENARLRATLNRVRALARELVTHGDMTPDGERMLSRILSDAEQPTEEPT